MRERRKVAEEYIDVLKKLGVLEERGGVFRVNEERLNRVLWLVPPEKRRYRSNIKNTVRKMEGGRKEEVLKRWRNAPTRQLEVLKLILNNLERLERERGQEADEKVRRNQEFVRLLKELGALREKDGRLEVDTDRLREALDVLPHRYYPEGSAPKSSIIKAAKRLGGVRKEDVPWTYLVPERVLRAVRFIAREGDEVERLKELAREERSRRAKEIAEKIRARREEELRRQREEWFKKAREDMENYLKVLKELGVLREEEGVLKVDERRLDDLIRRLPRLPGLPMRGSALRSAIRRLHGRRREDLFREEILRLYKLPGKIYPALRWYIENRERLEAELRQAESRRKRD